MTCQCTSRMIHTILELNWANNQLVGHKGCYTSLHDLKSINHNPYHDFGQNLGKGSCDMLANFEIPSQIYSRDQVKWTVSDNEDGASSGKTLILLEHSLKQGHCSTLLILENGNGHWYFGPRKSFLFKQHPLGSGRRWDKPWPTSTTELFGKLLKEFPSLSGLCSVQTLAYQTTSTKHFICSL